MGLTGTGTAVRFIPRPVVIGFTNGIALVIASTQIKDFFGIRAGDGAGRIHRPRRRAGRVRMDGVARDHRRWPPVSLVAIVVWNRFVPRVPGYIVALVGGTAVAALLRAVRRDDRQPLWRHSGRAAARSDSALPARPDPHAASRRR